MLMGLLLLGTEAVEAAVAFKVNAADADVAAAAFVSDVVANVVAIAQKILAQVGCFACMSWLRHGLAP